jgi:hypothetical protein
MAGPKQLAIVGAVVFAAACGGGVSSQMPAQDAARAQSSISAANAAGAQQDPRAALYLNYAKQSSANASKLTKKDEHESAKLLNNDAQADAQLATALTKQRQAEAQRQQARARLEGAQ